jgi:hypothetical protein
MTKASEYAAYDISTAYAAGATRSTKWRRYIGGVPKHICHCLLPFLMDLR